MKYNLVLAFILSFISKINLQSINTNTTCSYGYVFTNDACKECGKTDFAPNIKIVGGQVANPNSWPAQALVVMYYKANVSNYNTYSIISYCGGTLINSRTILTAAHCIFKEFTYNGKTYKITPNNYYPTLASMYRVYLGAHNISFIKSYDNPPASTLKMYVSNVIVHSSYNDSTYLNDIALLTLSSSVSTSSAIKYACLPKEQSTSIPIVNQACYAAGWGTLREGDIYRTPSVLYNVKLTIYNPTSCSNVYPLISKNWNSQICAGNIDGGKDTCQGDSGGGLYILDSTINKYIVVGITSYGEGCAKVGKPGIYTSVSNYIDWIKSNSLN